MQNITSSEDNAEKFLEFSRFSVQRVCVPILVFIGVTGNAITVMVLTRKRMRCTTNIYLTALAIADIVYLLVSLLLSLKHYPNSHDQKFSLYWRFVGIFHWLCDAASNTSVWLTVSFTIERYIAVCHPMKGKLLCTENRAKTIIAIVSVLCVISAVSTAFEHQLAIKTDCVLRCSNSTEAGNEMQTVNNSQIGNSNAGVLVFMYFPSSSNVSSSINSNNLNILPPASHKLFQQIQNYSAQHKLPIIQAPCLFLSNLVNHSLLNISVLNANKSGDSAEKEELKLVKDKQTRNIDDVDYEAQQNVEKTAKLNETDNLVCCKYKYTIDAEPTKLVQNETYKTTIYWFNAIIFVLLPLVLIATFNSFLINALYKSHRNRKEMTNSQDGTNLTSENRVTLILIGIVVLFLMCQTPTAFMLIYEIMTMHADKDLRTRNIVVGLNNIFNLLLSVNASCNFILYCVLSAKYRSTFKKLFCERQLKRQDTLSVTLTSRLTNSQRFNPNSKAFKRNASAYSPTPRNLETQSLVNAPRSKSLVVKSSAKSKSCDPLV